MDEETGSIISESTGIDSIASTSEKSINPPVPDVVFSDFGDSDCGEPLVAQHLVLDFTPLTDSVDDEIAQKKCCSFWEYIGSRRELHGMMVLPETQESSFSDVEKTIVKELSPKEKIKDGKTAVSMLEFVENKGLIDRIFEVRTQQSHCTLGSREYHENEPSKPSKKKKEEKITECTSTRNSCSKMRARSDGETRASAEDVQALCQNLQAWDNEHPKSMSPPGHPPALSHSVMQRRIM